MTIIAQLNQSIQEDRSNQKELFDTFIEDHDFPLIEPGRVTFFLLVNGPPRYRFYSTFYPWTRDQTGVTKNSGHQCLLAIHSIA